MFKSISYFLLAFMMMSLMALSSEWTNTPAYAAVDVGEPAPSFKALDIHGNEFDLEAHKGKIVVLEWTNHQCPFVVKHYSTGNMQSTQKKATDNGVVWVSIVSSAPGKQGNVTPKEAMEIEKDAGAHATTRILDQSGEIGKMYNARTTPHMFVISPDGNLAYKGAIDDNPSPNPNGVKTAKNLVLAALDDLSAGRAVAIPQTVPYGCSVKY